MRELVQHDVLPAIRSVRARQGLGPGEHDGSAIPGFAQPRRVFFDDDAAADDRLLRRDVAFRIHQDRQHVVEVHRLEACDQHADLRRDDDLHLVGEFQSVASFPIFLGKEDLHEIANPRLLGGREPRIVPDVFRDGRQPSRRQRLLQHLAATTIFEPTKEHGRFCSDGKESD